MLTSTHIDVDPLVFHAAAPVFDHAHPSGARLAANVRDALRSASYVPPDVVGIEVRDHAVCLSGTVRWGYQRVAAERAVENLAGVHVLNNRIRVIPRVSSSKTKAKILADLGASATGHRIDVDVDDETVTLTGAVASYGDRQIAERAARSMPGTRTVNNELNVVRC
jgi:osmotically-inducible protein OsmY